jgi:serine/threonine protein kinase
LHPCRPFENGTIIILIAMSNSKARYAILFKEGPGYILSKPLRHGSQAQAYVVLSLQDGKHYVRKKLKEFEGFQELHIYHRIPTTMAPALLLRTKYPDPQGDSLIYDFCNGGDLIYLKANLRRKEKGFPELMLWVVIKTMCEILAFTHHGWRCRLGAVKVEAYWNPIIHNDIHAGNIFLHWPDESAPLPSVLLGDFGSAQLVEGPAQEDAKVRVDPDTLDRDLSLFLNALLSLTDNGPDEIAQQSSPIWHVQKLRDEGMALAQGGCDVLVAQYMAERLIPMAEAAINRLQDGKPADFRWTKPVDSGAFLTFTGSEKKRKHALRQWTRNKNHERDVDEPWRWVEVDKLPASIPRTSRSNIE